MPYKVIAIETEEFISLADMKVHLRVQYTLEDTLIQSYIAEAIDYVETLTEKYIFVREVEEYFKKYKSKGLALCKGLVSSVESVSYIDLETEDSTYTPLDPIKYHKNLVSDPAKVTLKTDEIFPLLSDEPNPIKVTYKTGYSVANTPPKYKAAVKYLVAQKFQNRQNHVSRYRDIVTNILFSELDFSFQA